MICPDDIHVISTVAHSKSLSHAASLLFISRQGLSQKLTSIEQRYGVKLFDRTAAGIVLTEAGHAALKYAESVERLSSTLEAELAALGESFSSTIEVGMSLADGVALLPAIVAKFIEDNPSERIHLEADYEPGLIAGIKDRALDMAILENPPLEDGLEMVVLGYEKCVFLAPNKPPYSLSSQIVSLETLLSWPAVTYEWDSGWHLTGNRPLRERFGVTLKDHNMSVQFDSHEARINGVKAGIGWGAFPMCIARHYLSDPEVFRFTPDFGQLRFPVVLAWEEGRELSDGARRFRDFIRENIPDGFFPK